MSPDRPVLLAARRKPPSGGSGRGATPYREQSARLIVGEAAGAKRLVVRPARREISTASGVPHCRPGRLRRAGDSDRPLTLTAR